MIMIRNDISEDSNNLSSSSSDISNREISIADINFNPN